MNAPINHSTAYLADEATSEAPIYRPHIVARDDMAPALTPHRDIALIRIASCFEGEGIYAFYHPTPGGVDLRPPIYRRVTFAGTGRYALTADNPLYWPKDPDTGTRTQKPQFLDRRAFLSDLIGIVVGQITITSSPDYAAFVDQMKAGGVA